MKSRLTQILISGLVLGCLISGWSKALHAEVLQAVNEYYLIEADYNKELAYPGSRNLYLTVTLKTALNSDVPANKVLTFAKYEPPEDSNIEMNLVGHDPKQPAEKYQVEAYKFLVKIPEGIEARIYKLKFKFQYADKTIVDRLVDLSVGLRSKGKLTVIDSEPEPLTAGATATYNLQLRNDYPDYVINIHKLRIRSSPDGLINAVEVPDLDDIKAEVNNTTRTVTFKPSLSIKPFQQQTLALNMKLAHMSPSNWLLGFGEGSKLLFDIIYDDSNDRTISDFTKEAKIKIKPGDWTLLGAMLVGVVVGTGLKFYLDYLREKGVIDRRGVAVFLTITVVVGVVITIIAWAGQIQIIAFKNINVSYDRPVAIFTIGLIGALAGVHFLNAWAQKLLSPGGKAQEETKS